MSQLSNVIIDYGGANQITVHTTRINEVITKTIPVIKPPQTSGNRAEGPKTTKLIDLLRMEERYTISGYISYADRLTLKNIIKAGGSFDVWVLGDQIPCNSDKIEINTVPTDSDNANDVEDFQHEVTITLVVGEDIV